jgi:hypothetical protein
MAGEADAAGGFATLYVGKRRLATGVIAAGREMAVSG